MTPTQLRAYAEVARQGSVGGAAETLGVTDAAVSMHIRSLRKEFGDELFHRTGSGLAFTPGGLRLASRAVEMLGLQDRTRHEVTAAARGQRVLRLATTSMFAEYCAPGLIALFSARASDLEIELAVEPRERFTSLLAGHAVDVTIGPTPSYPDPGTERKQVLKFTLVVVADPSHELASRRARPADLARASWLLGPAAAERGLTRDLLEQLRVPEDRQRIFQSHAAAAKEARRGEGLVLALGFEVADDLKAGRLVRVSGEGTSVESTWTAMTLPPDRRSKDTMEFMHFIGTPRALQAMIHGSGTDIGRFKPSVHITLWH